MRVLNNVKNLRENLGISQSQLAKAIGVSRATVINIEKFAVDPNLKTAYKIANYFNLTIEDVFIFMKDSSEDLPYQMTIEDYESL